MWLEAKTLHMFFNYIPACNRHIEADNNYNYTSGNYDILQSILILNLEGNCLC